MSNIPQARKIIEDALNDIRAAERYISEALDMMKRRKPDFRHEAENHSLTPQQRREILKLRKRGMSQAAIARRLRIPNTGRVSEVVRPRERSTDA